MPTALEQVETLRAIKEYNERLKPSRAKKDALPEIRNAVNVAVRERQDMTVKKGEKDFPKKRFYH